MELWPLFKEAAQIYGLPFALFLALLVYVLWDSRQRENRYIQIIETLSEDVKERLTKIETKLNI
jgi:hypothetical protein